jgi:hypothetical protein
MTISGRQASRTGVLVAKSVCRPNSRDDTTMAASMPSSDRDHSPRTPALILSAVATVTSIADGSRLKCMIGARLPAMAESIMKLVSSAR